MDEVLFFVGLLVGVLVGMCFIYTNFMNDRQEGAMEVYRGNTTLEYKVVDGVKVDSCVIFKNK